MIIESDEWLSALLVKFLSGEGFECQVAAQARDGFDEARRVLPDCIVCDVFLSDIDGFWVARRVRGERSRLASTPFAFITKDDNHELRRQGLAFGADVFLSPPFRHEDVVAQVGALVGMAARLKEKRSGSASGGPPGAVAALRGDVAQLSVTTLLTMLEMERRTGRLRVSPPGGVEVVLELVEGTISGAQLAGKPDDPVRVLRRAVTWTRGSFSFEPTPTGAGMRRGHPVGPLLLEAMRQNDEAAR